ncbi:carboxypeptidase regulatory-like domain-containing protein [Chloroflexus sp.]|uniref:carboxypeptidase regulatory-like domain-containing protein n=1 Tax=Chloroflexus sp. TaxID=1904827 RepID=UPI0026217F4C|nr:carboxypeptidase regulatory-like domain-containing protein [uncultured Chloroflexus sp.]
MRSIAFLLALVSLIACSTTQSVPTSTTPNVVIPTPTSGEAVVFGRVLSSITGQPIYRVRVAFAEVLRNEETAIFVDDTGLSPFAETDLEGRFVVPNLPPKEYVIVVGDPFGLNDVVRDPTTGLPRIWSIEAGKQIDAGDLTVNIGV